MAEPAELALPALQTAPRVRRLGGPDFVNVMLILPALLFMVFGFVIPLGIVLLTSVKSTEVSTALPRTSADLAHWDGKALPDEAIFADLATDFADAPQGPVIPEAGTRLNYEIAGFRSLILKTRAQIHALKPPYKASFIALDERWNDLEYWHALKDAAPKYTAYYLLAAADFRLKWDGTITHEATEGFVYRDLIARTFWISLIITAACVILGYPLAYAIASASERASRLLLLAVLLPFWTSLLLRTTAWTILLQREGIVNSLLMGLGLTKAPVELIFNRTGVYITLTHIMLPFMVLPLYSVMKSIPAEQLRAAYSLGGRPLTSFFLVYLPQSLPGLIAGAVLVYIIVIGFYIAPALVGGGADQMIGYLIAYHGMETANFGMASALSVILLLSILLIFVLTRRYWRRGLLSAE